MLLPPSGNCGLCGMYIGMYIAIGCIGWWSRLPFYHLIYLTTALIYRSTICNLVSPFILLCFSQAMSPVKGTRKRHASTRAAMTAGPPGRLTVPDVRTEQITTPVLPSSAHTGTISLNLEALTASISVAVHQAVQSALIRASTFAGRPLIHVSPSQVPETSDWVGGISYDI